MGDYIEKESNSSAEAPPIVSSHNTKSSFYHLEDVQVTCTYICYSLLKCQKKRNPVQGKEELQKV